MNIKDKLQQPFPYDEIEWRAQSCGVSGGSRPWVIVLAYVQARAIQNRLDDVFGWDGWTDEYRAIEGNMICRLSVRTDGDWISKENGASETNMEAFKGGISGAFKRVAASGYGIGRYLYNLKESFAECTLEKPKNMNGWKKAQTKDKKHTIYWKTPLLPTWALPCPTLEEVEGEWVKKGGTPKQFEEYAKENFKVEKTEDLTPQHLAGLKSLLEKRTAS